MWGKGVVEAKCVVDEFRELLNLSSLFIRPTMGLKLQKDGVVS